MRDAKLPMAYRDNCANLLIPLNRCRSDTYYLPWKCEVGRDPELSPPPFLGRPAQLNRDPSRRARTTLGRAMGARNLRADTADRPLQQERHSYEKCQYDEFKKRVAKMDELREAKGGARSN